jgi:hypothetical protein
MKLSKNVIRSMTTDVKNKREKLERIKESASVLESQIDHLQKMIDQNSEGSTS